MERFLAAVSTESKARAADHELHDFDTVYFGGGTPSLLYPGQLKSLIDLLGSHYRISDKAEISIESNPSSLDFDKLLDYSKIGINRLSLGIQSFQDDNLRTLGRIHDSKKATESFYAARRAGFDNINIDLIYGIPGQSIADWERDLTRAIDLKPDHISAYNLIIEPNTRFGDLFRAGKLILPSEDEQREMYYSLIDLLSDSGYDHYELSNFAQNERYCRHNLNYWRNRSYLGLGPSAVSFDGETRFRNVADVEKYNDLIISADSAVETSEIIDGKLAVEETVMMGLRLSAGLSVRDLLKKRGYDILREKESEINVLLEKKYLIYENGSLKIAREGLFISDEIIVKLI